MKAGLGYAAGAALAAFSALAAENMVGTQTQNEGMLAPRAPGKVTVDGDGGDWDFSGAIRSFRDISLRDTYSVKTSAMWDEENLYLFFDWRDPTPMDSRVNPKQDPSHGWQADSEQFRIYNGRDMYWVTCWNYLGKTPVVDWSQRDFSKGGFNTGTIDAALMFKGEGVTELDRGVASAYRKAADGKGFTHEMRIPWKTMHMDGPPKGDDVFRIGYEFMWGNNQGAGTPLHRFADNMQPGKMQREFFWIGKEIWGDVKCVEKGPAQPRRYVPDAVTPEGAVELKVEVPAAAKRFTVVIDDRDGQRVRNLVGGDDPEFYNPVEKDGVRTLTVRWDALDESGCLVPPGEYVVRTQVLGEKLTGQAEHVFYNPGRPPWAVSSGPTGCWGADHMSFREVHRAGDLMILSAGFAEGGHATIAVDLEGRKVWGDRKGASYGCVAADADYVYLVPNDWEARGKQFLRMDAKTGKFAPFADADGNEGRMPILMTELWGEGATVETFMERYHTSTNPPTALLAEYGLRSVKPHTGAYDPLEVHDVLSAAVDARGRLWVVENCELPRRVSVWERPKDGKPKLAMDFIGNAHYAGSGTLLHDVDPTLVYASGNEIRLGKGLDDWRLERIMWAVDRTKVDALPSPETGHFFFSDASGARREYFVARPAIGSLLEVFMRGEGGDWRPVCGIFELARLQGLFGGTYGAQHVRAPRGQFADDDPGDVLIWTDGNADGLVQRAECAIVKAVEKTVLPDQDVRDEKGRKLRRRNGNAQWPMKGGGWRRTVDVRDFSFIADGRMGNPKTLGIKGDEWRGLSTVWRVAPERVRPDGVPVYTTNSWTRLGAMAGWSVTESLNANDGTDNVIAFARQTVQRQQTDWIIGFDGRTGKVNWRVRELYHQVGGSHHAPMARAGLIIGALNFCGVANGGTGDAPGVVMMRGNLGEDYYLTTDGIYVSSFFKDCRLPAVALPDTLAELPAVDMDSLSGGSEQFCGTFARQSDGKMRMNCGVARQSGMTVRIDGLDSIRRLKDRTVTLGTEQLLAAGRDNAERAARAAVPAEADVLRVTRDRKGAVVFAKGEVVVEQKGLARAGVRLGWDDENLYARFSVADSSPWRNGANDRHLLFKGGDCVEMQFSATGNSKDRAVEGDVRFVAAPFGGKPAVLEMREVSAARKAPHDYTSPVTTFKFACAELTDRVTAKVESVKGDEYAVLLTIPFAEIGVKPAAGLKLRADLGFILSNPAGTENAARVYWSNKDTGLVSDIPHEARMYPAKMGTLTLK